MRKRWRWKVMLNISWGWGRGCRCRVEWTGSCTCGWGGGSCCCTWWGRYWVENCCLDSWEDRLAYLTTVKSFIAANKNPVVRESEVGTWPTQTSSTEPCIIYLSAKKSCLVCWICYIGEMKDLFLWISTKKKNVDKVELCDFRSTRVPCVLLFLISDGRDMGLLRGLTNKTSPLFLSDGHACCWKAGDNFVARIELAFRFCLDNWRQVCDSLSWTDCSTTLTIARCR